MNAPHPIPYQGSKRKIAQGIVTFIPLGTKRLIEPFAGSAAVSLAAASLGKAEHFIINDINLPLIALWDQIINHPSELLSHYQDLWEAQQGHEKEYYFFIRDEFNRTQRPDYLLFLLVRCVKAAVRYNSNGQFNQSPDNRRRGTHPATLTKNVLEASLLLRGRSTLTSTDYRAILEHVQPSDVVYMDPPYQGVSGERDKRYLESLSFDHFVETLETLNQKDIPYIVSYDGRTGSKLHGQRLPEYLGLEHLEIDAGRSSQETLLGRDAKTYESLYLSPSLIERTSSLNGLCDEAEDRFRNSQVAKVGQR